MAGLVKDIINAKHRAGERAFLWLTHTRVAVLYDKEEDSYESGTPIRRWVLDSIEREELIGTGLVDGMGVLGCKGDDSYEIVKRICFEMLRSIDPIDPTLFDLITSQLVAAGVEIDKAATTKARTKSPNVVSVFNAEGIEGDLDYAELLGGDVIFWGYSGEFQVELLTAKQAQHYYEDAPITPADLTGLRFIEKDGQKFYDESDLDLISKRKNEERKARWEAARNISLVLPDEFLKLCDEVKESPATILQGFIADLCHLETTPYITSGSDECDMALAYFDRCGYPWRVEMDSEEKARG